MHLPPCPSPRPEEPPHLWVPCLPCSYPKQLPMASLSPSGSRHHHLSLQRPVSLSSFLSPQAFPSEQEVGSF